MPRIATLPATPLSVAADPNTSGQNNPSQTEDGLTAAPQLDQQPGSYGSNPWIIVSISLASLWLLTTVVLVTKLHRNNAHRAANPAIESFDNVSRTRLLAQIRQACADNNARDAYDGLRKWALSSSPDIPAANSGDWLSALPDRRLRSAIFA